METHNQLMLAGSVSHWIKFATCTPVYNARLAGTGHDVWHMLLSLAQERRDAAFAS